VKMQNIHLLFQSSGGSVGDGVFLYNLFKSLPIRLTIYNVGSVCSIAVVAYMGAARRVVSPRATFMIHQTTTKLAGAPGMIMKGVTKSLITDDERAESILSADITLADGERWSNLDYYDFYFSGKEAVAIGLAHELGEFSPPAGTPVRSRDLGGFSITVRFTGHPYLMAGAGGMPSISADALRRLPMPANC
jgi:ATP-dependent protease ClpP protease subunit